MITILLITPGAKWLIGLCAAVILLAIIAYVILGLGVTGTIDEGSSFGEDIKTKDT